ncbi:amino acid ABC transporter permease [Thauera sp. SDU_THAU2]|uniref:amino acid ABC transporter permease n=1 Tax=Thauera sp. SDU_THAU2 TaxID=3136633 RepID=UPI00311E6C11
MLTQFSIWALLDSLAEGAKWTVALSLIAFVCGGIAGLVVLFARVSGKRAPTVLSKAYIEVFQGTPLLMQLFIIFFGLSMLGVDVSAWLAAAVGLTLFTSAYLAEIWRGCVEAVPKGQWEASASLALNYREQMRHVVLPQALRIAIAPTVGFLVQVVKSTAVASIIGFTELTKTASMLANATFQPFLIFGLVAIAYFLLCYPLSLYARHLETKYHAAR